MFDFKVCSRAFQCSQQPYFKVCIILPVNKTEAAAYLGKSPRTLNTYLASGRLTVRYIKGKTSDQADFDEADLQRLKAELDTLLTPTPLEVAESVATMTEAKTETALARLRQPSVNLAASDLNLLMEELLKSRGVPLESKLTLSLPEASQLSGISLRFIRDAIKQGELPSIHIGRSHRIVTRELEAWVSKLK
jgi:excisionase family DNA binding protein